MLSPDEFEELRRHRNCTIGLFVAFWIWVIVVIAAMTLFDLSQVTQDNLIGVLGGAVIVLALLQFSMRCPNCRANLGWQVRLGIPRNCRKCGVDFREM